MKRFDQMARRLSWGCAIAADILYVTYPLRAASYVVHEPFHVLFGLFASLVLPALPFAMLLIHLSLRSNEGRPSTAVALSVAVSSVLTLAFTVCVFFVAVLPEDYGLITVAFLPFVAVPLAAVICFVAWGLATTVLRINTKQKR